MTPDEPGRAGGPVGVLVIRVEDVGLDGEGFATAMRLVHDALPEGQIKAWVAIEDVADRILAEFADLASEPTP